MKGPLRCRLRIEVPRPRHPYPLSSLFNLCTYTMRKTGGGSNSGVIEVEFSGLGLACVCFWFLFLLCLFLCRIPCFHGRKKRTMQQPQGRYVGCVLQILSRRKRSHERGYIKLTLACTKVRFSCCSPNRGNGAGSYCSFASLCSGSTTTPILCE